MDNRRLLDTQGDCLTESTLIVCVLLCVSLLVGVAGNLLVVCVVLGNRSLRTANNALIVNLAASDLIRCALDTPLFLASLLWTPRCTTMNSGVQLLSLVGISVERFRSVAFPFRSDAWRRGRARVRVQLWVAAIWILGLTLAVVSLYLSSDPLLYMMCSHLQPPGGLTLLHTHTNLVWVDGFGPLVLVPVWACCLVLMALHYGRLFLLVRQHSHRIFDRGVQLRLSLAKAGKGGGAHGHGHAHAQGGWQRAAQRTRSPALPPPPSSRRPIDEQHPPVQHSITAEMTPKVVRIVTTETTPEAVRSVTVAATSEVSGTVSMATTPTAPPEMVPSSVTMAVIPEVVRTVSVAATPAIVGAVCILTPVARELGQKRLEGELAKRCGGITIIAIQGSHGCGGIIIAILLCWLPLAICLTINTTGPQGWLLRELQTCAMVLTCVPAAIHPLIYSLLNRQLRAEMQHTLTALRTHTLTVLRSCRRQ
ncbi:D(4) dopamine receptor-like [Engraulis encrasicolus]|uniref:D(4) dopamine receptor-like n=1 Tax=Engraulis encrasicolus TaxID=184585 RepID=UPI002FCFB341